MSMNKFTKFVKISDEWYGVLSYDSTGAYLVPRSQWVHSSGEYDNEDICSSFYDASRYNGELFSNPRIDER